MLSHKDVQPHVSINDAACYQTEATLMRCASIPSKGVVHPISVLQLPENEVYASSMSRTADSPSISVADSPFRSPAKTHCPGNVPLATVTAVFVGDVLDASTFGSPAQSGGR